MVGKLDPQTIGAKITVQGPLNTHHAVSLMLATDQAYPRLFLNCKFVKTSKRFRPYGAAYHLLIKGKARCDLNC